MNQEIETGRKPSLEYRTLGDEVKAWFLYAGVMQDLEILKKVGIHYANDGIKLKYLKGNPYEVAKALWMQEVKFH